MPFLTPTSASTLSTNQPLKSVVANMSLLDFVLSSVTATIKKKSYYYLF
jgi:hypothetical protein